MKGRIAGLSDQSRTRREYLLVSSRSGKLLNYKFVVRSSVAQLFSGSQPVDSAAAAKF